MLRLIASTAATTHIADSHDQPIPSPTTGRDIVQRRYADYTL
ncbi:MAG: hypothetical protein P8L85_00445 [Rubripirellula sp.]|nr:hypothetical protein [Rubripirellula sp.]